MDSLRAGQMDLWGDDPFGDAEISEQKRRKYVEDEAEYTSEEELNNDSSSEKAGIEAKGGELTDIEAEEDAAKKLDEARVGGLSDKDDSGDKGSLDSNASLDEDSLEDEGRAEAVRLRTELNERGIDEIDLDKEMRDSDGSFAGDEGRKERMNEMANRSRKKKVYVDSSDDEETDDSLKSYAHRLNEIAAGDKYLRVSESGPEKEKLKKEVKRFNRAGRTIKFSDCFNKSDESGGERGENYGIKDDSLDEGRNTSTESGRTARNRRRRKLRDPQKENARKHVRRKEKGKELKEEREAAMELEKERANVVREIVRQKDEKDFVSFVVEESDRLRPVRVLIRRSRWDIDIAYLIYGMMTRTEIKRLEIELGSNGFIQMTERHQPIKSLGTAASRDITFRPVMKRVMRTGVTYSSRLPDDCAINNYWDGIWDEEIEAREELDLVRTCAQSDEWERVYEYQDEYYSGSKKILGSHLEGDLTKIRNVLKDLIEERSLKLEFAEFEDVPIITGPFRYVVEKDDIRYVISGALTRLGVEGLEACLQAKRYRILISKHREMEIEEAESVVFCRPAFFRTSEEGDMVRNESRSLRSGDEDEDEEKESERMRERRREKLKEAEMREEMAKLAGTAIAELWEGDRWDSRVVMRELYALWKSAKDDLCWQPIIEDNGLFRRDGMILTVPGLRELKTICRSFCADLKSEDGDPETGEGGGGYDIKPEHLILYRAGSWKIKSFKEILGEEKFGEGMSGSMKEELKKFQWVFPRAYELEVQNELRKGKLSKRRKEELVKPIKTIKSKRERARQRGRREKEYREEISNLISSGHESPITKRLRSDALRERRSKRKPTDAELIKMRQRVLSRNPLRYERKAKYLKYLRVALQLYDFSYEVEGILREEDAELLMKLLRMSEYLIVETIEVDATQCYTGEVSWTGVICRPVYKLVKTGAKRRSVRTLKEGQADSSGDEDLWDWAKVSNVGKECFFKGRKQTTLIKRLRSICSAVYGFINPTETQVPIMPEGKLKSFRISLKEKSEEEAAGKCSSDESEEGDFVSDVSLLDDSLAGNDSDGQVVEGGEESLISKKHESGPKGDHQKGGKGWNSDVSLQDDSLGEEKIENDSQEEAGDI